MIYLVFFFFFGLFSLSFFFFFINIGGERCAEEPIEKDRLTMINDVDLFVSRFLFRSVVFCLGIVGITHAEGWD